MKKLLFLPLVLISCLCFAQDIFPAYDTSIISDKELKVMPLIEALRSEGYRGFYKDDKLKKKYELDGYNSKYSSLVGKIFKVKNIIPYTSSLGTQKFKLVLLSQEAEEVFYDYDPKYEHLWNFEIMGELNLPKDFFCRDIKMTADKFTNDTTYTTKAKDGIVFLKIKKGGQDFYYLSSNIVGSTLNVREKGLILLLENNKRIEKPDVVLDVEVSSGSSWVYKAFVRLTKDDIDLISNNVITDKRHYIYDASVKNGKILSEYLKCLLLK